MNKKSTFISWVSEHKLRTTNANEFSDTLERVFLSYFDMDVWAIEDSKEFSDLRNLLLGKKEFKKNDKKSFKLLKYYGKTYQNFLCLYDDKPENDDGQVNDEQSLSNIKSKEVQKEIVNIKFIDENKKIIDFFNNIDLSNRFYKIFEYDKSEMPDLVLDVRETIIGVKLEGERLRFYSDKNGQLKIKVSSSNSTTLSLLSFDFEDVQSQIDESNIYFNSNTSEVTIEKKDAENFGYVYHRTFKFGVIKKKERTYVVVSFDDYPNNKTIDISHPFLIEISENDYINKIIPSEKEEKETKVLRIPWDKYETALLIETFWQIESKSIDKTDALNKLSKDLRQMAVNQGKTIDDVFRNLNGMNIQLANVALSFYPDRSSMHRTAIFDEIAEIYKTNKAEFNSILNEAHRLVDLNKTISSVPFSLSIDEADYYSYVKMLYETKHTNDGKAHKAGSHARKCVESLRNLSNYFVEKGENIDVFAIHSNEGGYEVYKKLCDNEKNFQVDTFKWHKYALANYIHFIAKETESIQKYADVADNKAIYPSDYAAVIEKVFPDGYPFANPLKKRRFVSSYDDINGSEFNDNETTYESKIRACGFISENKVYLPTMVNADLKDKIQKFIDDALQNNTSALFYSNLFELFKDNLNPIFGPDMFASYLKFIFKGIYKFEDEFICKKGNQVDLVQELINVFMNCGRPLNIEEIYSELPTVSHSAIDKTLNDKNFLVNYRGKSYFYKGIIAIDECDYNEIYRFIKNGVLKNGSVTGLELYNFIKKELPHLIDNNPDVTDLGFKNFIKLKFEQNFCFNGDIISSRDNDVDIKTLYTNFAKQREKFTLKELEEYRDSIHQSYIDYKSILAVSVRLNQNEFIRGDLVDFDVSSIDDAISKYCNNGYASFCDIINYTDFPSILYIWNSYVLESYVYCRSKRFRLLNAAFNKKKPVGVILNRNSAYETFDDVLIDVIRKSGRSEKDDVYSYLIDNDYLLTKKYKNIDFLINEARK